MSKYTITLSDGSISLDFYSLETSGPGTNVTRRTILSTNNNGDVGAHYFRLSGDIAGRFIGGFTFIVVDSSGNDGTFTVAPGGAEMVPLIQTVNAGTPEEEIIIIDEFTHVYVVESIPDITAPFGDVAYTVPGLTSVLIPGRGSLNYGHSVITSTIHMLENFAAPIQPENMLAGQVWYDTFTGSLRLLKTAGGVLDGILLTSGDTAFTGDLDMGTNKIINLVTGTEDDHAVTKKYVDDTFVDVAGDSMTGSIIFDPLKGITSSSGASIITDATGDTFIVTAGAPGAAPFKINKSTGDTLFQITGMDVLEINTLVDLNNNTLKNIGDPAPDETGDSSGFDRSYADGRYVPLVGDISLSGNLNFDIPTTASDSFGIKWTGVSDTYSMFVENINGVENTKLIIQVADNFDDYISFQFRGTNSSGAPITELVAIKPSVMEINTTLSMNKKITFASRTAVGEIGLQMSNNDIVGVHRLEFNDPGFNDGLFWNAGSGWSITESPDTLTDASGNLQFVLGTTRVLTIKTTKQLDIPVATGTAPLVIASTTKVDNLNSDTVDGQHANEMSWGHLYPHTTSIDFNSFLNTDKFGANFIYGTAGGPGVDSASQYYHSRWGLGSDYDNFSMQMAIGRDVTTPYISIRFEESGSAGAWQKITAGDSDKLGGYPANNYARTDIALETFDGGLNTTIDVLCDDLGNATLRLYGPSQGSGRLFVGQSLTHGGGIEYNGDSNPLLSGAGSDWTALYRITNGTASWTARNFVNDNHWEFRDNVTVGGEINLPTAGKGIHLTNGNITGVNNIEILDAGPNEGIQWNAGSGWKIFECLNDLTTNTTPGNLQFVLGTTRVLTINTSKQIEIPVATGTAPLVIVSTTKVSNLNVDLLDGVNADEMSWGNVDDHSAYTDFNAFLGTRKFGVFHVHGNTNGPNDPGSNEYFHARWSAGRNLGNGSSMQQAIGWQQDAPYMYIRYEHANTLTSWSKLSAGNSDTLGGVTATKYARTDVALETFDGGQNTTIDIKCDDNGNAILRLYGNSQGSGRLFVGQSVAYGGGIEYNGDSSPLLSGAGSDYTALFRVTNGTAYWTARNNANTNHWDFRGNITLGGTVDGRDVKADGTKLDTIETNATADQTAAQLLASIKTVDVNGTSGLNAGTFDGFGLSSGESANTVVRRDSSKDIHARLFRSGYDSTNASIGYIMTQIDTASNNYIRPSTPAQFRYAVTRLYYSTLGHTHSYALVNHTHSTSAPIKVTSGRVSTLNRHTHANHDHSGDFSVNYRDIYPPSGYSMSNLLGFTASIGFIYFYGTVNSDDRLWCSYTYYSNRIRVICQNSENRQASIVNYMAIWR